MSFYGKFFLQEKHWHLVLLHHSWQHSGVLNWLLAPDKNTKTLQYAWVLTENSKCCFMLRFITLTFLLLASASVQVAEPVVLYFTAAELQFVSCTYDYHQLRLYHLLLLCHSLLHHRYSVTASLLSKPHPVLPQPTVSPPPPPPPLPVHYHPIMLTYHHTALPLLLQSFIFHFWILHLHF